MHYGYPGSGVATQDREASEGAGVEDSTWEREDMMQATYPFLFRDEGTWFSSLILK